MTTWRKSRISSIEKEQPFEQGDVKEKSADFYNLILYNDDFNTFDHVIESLVDICNHEPIQAEQCAYIVHYTGKCDVKNGYFPSLKPLKSALIEKGLSVTIEKV